jgi:hypothetical protein
VFSIGPFKDVSRTSAYLRAPRHGGLTGSITRANSQGEGASFFWLAGQVPLRSNFLIQVDGLYASVGRGDDIEDGFGDVTVSARARVWKGSGKKFLLNGAVRLGSGTINLFPYSTASTDIEVGAAFIDSVGARSGTGRLEPLKSISWWVNLTGAYIVRLNDNLEESGLHEDHVDFGGGIIYPLTHRIEVEAGAMGLFFKSGAVRQIYYGQFLGRFSPSIDLFVTAQAERGDWRDRAVDASVAIGLKVIF